MKKDQIRKAVADFYETIAKEKRAVGVNLQELNLSLGYSPQDLALIPEEAQLGLGCGNPKLRARPRAGEWLADLGSGRGMDVFLLAKSLGDKGRAIGIDSNYAMVEKAREIARKKDFKNTEFRLGEIEHLPLADGLLDLVISNCVINLSTDKRAVYSEIYRVLKPGGRISISDILLKKELSQEIKADPNIYGT